ncbi:unnamed protein product [Rotaria socialis]|uniref:EF-hand domain-containing protein n=2 Tax=Rotaria socialis TaxID=392032 RepID=A0A818I3I0_9BILA|nr:unnamed protein product [Rotaria socialis]CAF3334581.1 unnamed protein product [Rotaria socialis]CAF3373719.1 unnamed protein product [Rotaria socialis]CAF3435935.1 unnamed protein product [Rotaria socialis]CAF3515658.1 unnamed protein product [Rotaria socialis]
MMGSKFTIVHLLLVTALIHFLQASFTEVPPPPKRPERFNSREELKKYLQKVHEYHMIVGRWRLRRDHEQPEYDTPSNNDLFKFFDINNDHFISNKEFVQRMRFKT